METAQDRNFIQGVGTLIDMRPEQGGDIGLSIVNHYCALFDQSQCVYSTDIRGFLMGKS
ncbi:hypothetical protein D3C80_1694030 [compost metagenome]